MNTNYINNQNSVLLYLDTREYPLERQAEILAAKNQGYKLCIATPTPDKYQGFNIDYLLEVNIANYQEAEQQILDYVYDHKINITGIIAWKDREVILASILGKALSLPHTPVEVVENVRNKVKTRLLLDRFQGINPDYAVVTNEEQFMLAINKIGVPCVLKQAGNSGGRGMRNIDTLDSALTIYKQFIISNKAQASEMYHYFNEASLLEKKIFGTEHSVNGVVANGEVITLGIIDKKIDHVISLQYENIVPSSLDLEVRKKVISIANEVIKALKLNWCGFHIDFMVTENNEIKILEVGGRLGGEMINAYLIPLAQPGINPYEILIEVVQGRLPLLEKDYTEKFVSKAASRVIISPKTGIISSVEGIEKVFCNSYCRYFFQRYGIGDEMVGADVKFKNQEIGYIIAQCNNSEDIEKIVLNLVNKIKLIVQ